MFEQPRESAPVREELIDQAHARESGPRRTADGGVRLFAARTVREALVKVREALGPDAYILEQRTVDGRIEILACLDVPVAEPAVPKHRFGVALKEAGFSAQCIAALPPRLATRDELTVALGELIPCLPPSQPLEGHFRLVGPHGAGKTTAVIKLMANRVLRYGHAGALLVGTDRQRMSGCEQLATAAALLGVEYEECTEQALPELLGRSRHLHLVLIDSPGVDRLCVPNPVDGVTDVLALPAIWQPPALSRLRRQFAAYPLSGIALTHLDQAEQLSGCASLLVDWQLPVWWTSGSSELSVELDDATPEVLGRWLLKGLPVEADANMEKTQ